MLRKAFFALFAVVAAASSANAAVMVGMILDPATTAGAGSGSNRTGAGTYHVYALDNGADFGISSYNIGLAGVGVVNHRSPNASFEDSQGNPAGSGFPTQRQTAPTLAAGPPLPPATGVQASVGVDFFPITGFGQTASGFAAKYPANTALSGGTTTWGNYLTEGHLNALLAFNGQPNPPTQKWVFIAEGTYTPGGPVPPSILTAATTVYTNNTDSYLSGVPAGGTVVLAVPEPATIAMLGLALCGGFGLLRRRS